MVGENNTGMIQIEGTIAKAVVDTGSMVTTISEKLYKQLDPKPKLHSMEKFKLNVLTSTGDCIPYIGYIEARIYVPFLKDKSFDVPVLVVPDCRANESEPVIVGTNFIRLCKSEVTSENESNLPDEWDTAFTSITNHIGTVRTTQNIKLAPNEVRTITGFVRKMKSVDAAVTEMSEENHCSAKVQVCPRVVTLGKCGNTARVPVRIVNVSSTYVSIPAKSTVCELQEVNVLRDIFQDVEKSEDDRKVTSKKQQINEEECQKPNFNLENSNLTKKEKEKATKFLNSWQHIFSKGPTDLGNTDLIEHEIHLKDEKPFKEPHRHIPPGLLNEVREHLQDMLKAGAIRESKSPFSSNVVIVRKKDGSIRMCVDYRKLNQRTIKDAYQIPRIENTLHLLSGAKYFSKLDLCSGYWQVSMKEEDKQKTAFSVGPLGFYEANRMPFGLTNAPATFQRLMERCMGELNLRDCLIYLDDVIIFSQTFDEHLERLNSVFSRLEQHNLKLKSTKCEFFQRKITYLGHVVSEEGIEADPEKIEAVKSWAVPKSTKDVRKFLGFTGYYRRFVKNYAKIVRPLNDLLVGNCTKKNKNKKSSKKGVPFVWGKEQQEAFEKIKDILIHPPILAYANYKLPFRVHTDACTTGLGAVLYQRQGGHDRVIAYASRSLKSSERNYPAHKLEFLALKWAVTEKFNDYLYGCDFEVWTDSNPLTYVQTTAKLDATGHRWLAALNSFNYTIKYRSGSKNADADGLSRRHEHEFVETIPEKTVKSLSQAARADISQAPLVFSTTDPKDLPAIEETTPDIPDNIQADALSSREWQKSQSEDAVISEIISHLRKGTRPRVTRVSSGTRSHINKYLRVWDTLILRDNVLYHSGKVNGEDYLQLVLPSSLREEIFKALHDDLGHQGRDRTISLFKQRFFWPGMDTWIEEKVKSCDRCIRRKTLPSTATLCPIQSSAPMEIICIDFLSLEKSKGGYENILVITDHFTRYSQAYPTKNQLARTTAKVLFENFITHYGFPSRIHSDQGPNFESELIKDLCELAGISKSHTTPYHPMGNGQVERFNSTLLKMLGTLEESAKSDWKSHVAPMVHAYNVTIHKSTGHSPYFLMFGRHPKLAIDAMLGLSANDDNYQSKHDYIRQLKDRLSKAYKKAETFASKGAADNKARYDAKAKACKLAVGDLVLVRNVSLRGKNKLADKWEETPYIVVSQPNPDIPVYEVKKDAPHTKATRTLHRNLLLPLGYQKISPSSEKYIPPHRR